MTPADLLASLRADGVNLYLEAGQPRLRGTPTDVQRAAIAANREALLDLLWDEQPDTTTTIGGAWFTYGGPSDG